MTLRTEVAPREARAEGVSCFHCGLPVTVPGRYTAVVGGVRRELCCAGCQAVTETICGSGLEAFYRNREAVAGGTRDGEAEPATPEALAIYDRPEVQQGFVETLPDGAREATLLLEGITCAACIWLNEQHLARQPGVLAVHINYATRRARVRWDPMVTRLSTLLEAVQAIGYRAWPNDNALEERLERTERRKALWRLFVAAFGMMQVMMYAYPAYIAGEGEMTADIAALMRWASLLLTVPVVAYSAAPFFQGALRDFRLRRVGMDVPVALGVGAAFAGSVWATFTGQGDVYFDSVTMFVFFLLCGRFLEAAARRRAGEALRHLARAMPAKANRLRAEDAEAAPEVVPAASLQPGERVLVRPGEPFPSDGTLERGRTRVDESLLTGESRPVPKEIGADLIGGAVNVGDPVVMRVTRVGADTRLAAIVRLVERAQNSRPPIVQVADRVASWFVLAVLAIAAGTAVAWAWLDPTRALPVAVAVLVVTCPCALSLATPAALAVAAGAFARRGLVVTRSDAIEALARATHVVFDKTGTLTQGALQVMEVRCLGHLPEARCRALAAALEQGSAHPIALALRTVAPAPGITDLRHVAGSGMEGVEAGRRVRIGNRTFALEHVRHGADAAPGLADDPARTEVWLADEDGPLAVFYLGDRIREEAAEVVARLQRAGKVVLLASGDGPGPVADVARRVGIDTAHVALTPEGKRELIVALQAQGHRVAMVGDGVNDAPVLAQAQVAVAMGSGAVLAQTAADAVITSGRLHALADGMALAGHTMQVVRQNLLWAFLYNVITVPLAAFGFITPWLAGIGMSASSLLVVANALRLRAAPSPRQTSDAPAAWPARAGA
jgi:Cu2+-exporting ATPase